MSSTQQFSLKWTNYTNHITNAFESLRSKEDFCDVTLCVEGRKIRAHKVLLSACSTYFKEIFKENPCQHPVIIFKNVKYDDLLSIVVYMYQGEVNIEQDALPTFLHTAEMLSIQGLTEDDGTQSDKSIIAVPPPQPQQTVVAAALATHTPQNTITIHGQTLGKAVRDTTHLATQKFTLSKPISIIGTTNAGTVDQIVYTTMAQAPTTLMQADVIPAKRKRKIITPAETKTVTYAENNAPKPAGESASPVAKRAEHETEDFLKQEMDTDISGEYEDDKPYQTEGEIGTYETGSQDNAKTDDDFDKPKLATQAELGRLFSSGGPPTPESKRSGQEPTPAWNNNSGVDENLKCKSCNRTFTSIAAKRRHMASRHSQIKQLISCKTCGKEFKTKWSLATHVSRFHR
ncbi:modifier of mdg4-like isoform X2 [Contarinia nasturtii]|uniref:modifier of mdg4-like isoform X2 n=1 Tax=Contarinia nasturtii TaxID=265458 RepID=UPI0012D3EA10|nr:modifier of mdg4-like isoform X2 [Contarinia nasturtii]